MTKKSSAWEKLGGPVLVCDFDGVIHDYSNGFQGVDVYGDIIEGAREALEELSEKWYIIIFTTRATSPELMAWLLSHDVKCNTINTLDHNPPNTSVKPIATVYLDDRSWPFVAGDKPQFDKEVWEQVVKDLNNFYIKLEKIQNAY